MYKSIIKILLHKRVIKFLFVIGISLLINACTTKQIKSDLENTTQSAPIQDKKINPFLPKKPLKLSEKGTFLYSILIDKKQGTYSKKYHFNSKYNKNTVLKDNALKKYELVKIYQDGAYPAYQPNTSDQPKNTLFKDTTFSGINFQQKGRVVSSQSTLFDQDKFIKITKKAINWVEKNTQFKVKLEIKDQINTEYTTATLLIDHPPTLVIKKVEFIINESYLYADLNKEEHLNSMLKKQVYKLGIPNGKNRIKVLVTAKTKAIATDKKM